MRNDYFYTNPFSLIIFYHSIWSGFELFGLILVSNILNNNTSHAIIYFQVMRELLALDRNTCNQINGCELQVLDGITLNQIIACE